MVVNDRLNMVFIPTAVIWKWEQYGNNFIAVFPLSPRPSKIFFNLSANSPVAGSWFNEMPLEQSASFNNECPQREVEKWISLDRSSLGKRIIEWGSFNKTDFFCENSMSVLLNTPCIISVLLKQPSKSA